MSSRTQHLRAEIVGDRDLVAAQIGLLRTDQALVEDLEPTLGLLLAPGNGRRLRLVAAPLVRREGLRVNEAVADVPVDVAVEPVHHLVDPCPLAQVLRVGRRAFLVRQVLEDRRALGQAEIAVLQHRDQEARIDLRVVGLQVLAGKEIHDLELDLGRLLGGVQHHDAARRRGRVVIDLHGCPPRGVSVGPGDELRPAVAPAGQMRRVHLPTVGRHGRRLGAGRAGYHRAPVSSFRSPA